MPVFKHSESTKIHRLHAFTYANATARTSASGMTSADIGKRAYQSDNKTFWDIKDVVSGVPTWTASGSNVASTDDVAEGSTNLYFTENRVRNTVLTGLSLASSAVISAADSILSALGKVQAQVSLKQNTITLTTTGSSGAATFSSATLNIPNYTLSGLGGIGLTNLSATSPILYNNLTGDFSIQQSSTSQGGYLSSTDWNTFNGKQNAITLTTTGTSGAATLIGATLNIPNYTGLTLGALSATSPLLYNNSTGVFSIQVANGSQNGYLSSTDWSTFNNKQGTITLTTTGTSGAATFSGGTLNIPNYTAGFTTSSTDTLSNKRVQPRVVSTTSSATPSINTDNTDIFRLTAQAVDITSFTTNLTGTPIEGELLQIQITGTAARSITWGTSFTSSTIILPATTVTTNTLRVTFQWDSVISKWVCVGLA